MLPSRHSLAIVLASLAACAYFTAHGATRLVALSWLDLQPTADVVAARRPTPAEVDAAGSAQHRARDILARNVFDSETGPLWPPPEPEADAHDALEDADAGVALGAEDRPPACDAELRLVGTFFDMHRPHRSLAWLRTKDSEAEFARLGQELDGYRLTEIFPRAVYLTRTEKQAVCALYLFQEQQGELHQVAEADTAKKETKPKPTSKRSKRRNAGMDSEEIARHVQRVSDNSYRVDRSFLDKLIGNQAGLMGVARVQPVRRGGQPSGVRLTGFKSDELLGQLGLRSGDVLRTINGYDMTSPDSALEAYVRLKQADHLTLSVVRRGKPVSIEYRVQ